MAVSFSKFGPMWQFECNECRRISDVYDTKEERDLYLKEHRDWHKANPPCTKCYREARSPL